MSITCCFVAADLDASRALYTAALAPLGYEELYVQDDGLGYWAEGLDDFVVNNLHQNNVEALWHAPAPVVDAPRRPGVP